MYKIISSIIYMTTRRDILQNQYLILCKQITNLLDKQIMPDLNTYELSDIIFILIQHFSDVSNENYKSKIDFIIDLDTSHLVGQDDRNKIYDIVYEFVLWFKQLK